MSTPAGTEGHPAHRSRKFAIFIATAAGLGYIPFAPGTFGSLAGVALYWRADHGTRTFISLSCSPRFEKGFLSASPYMILFRCAYVTAIICVGVALKEYVTSSQAAKFCRQKDPQFVVIDEVSGQFFLIVSYSPLSGAPAILASVNHPSPWSPPTGNICCWVLYFFAYSISGSLSQCGKPSRFPADGVSCQTTGSPGFTPAFAFGLSGQDVEAQTFAFDS